MQIYLLLISICFARVEIPVVKQLWDTYLFGKEAANYQHTAAPAIPALTFTWESVAELEKRQTKFVEFYTWFNNTSIEYGEQATAHYYHGKIDPKHMITLRSQLNDYFYSGNAARKEYIARMILNALYLATPQYKHHLLQQYAVDLDAAVEQKKLDKRYWVWPKERLSVAFNGTSWNLYQTRRDVMFVTYMLATFPFRLMYRGATACVGALCTVATLPVKLAYRGAKACVGAACTVATYPYRATKACVGATCSLVTRAGKACIDGLCEDVEEDSCNDGVCIVVDAVEVCKGDDCNVELVEAVRVCEGDACNAELVEAIEVCKDGFCTIEVVEACKDDACFAKYGKAVEDCSDDSCSTEEGEAFKTCTEDDCSVEDESSEDFTTFFDIVEKFLNPELQE